MPSINKNKYVWLVFAVAVKIAYLFAFAYWHHSEALLNNFQLYAFGGDARDYVEPVENLLKEGRHYFAENIYAGRMPGFTFLYLPIRLIFSQHLALNITLIVQTILSGVSVYALSRVFYSYTKSNSGAFFVYFIYLFSTYVSAYDGEILSESLAVSTLIFSFYFLFKYSEDKSTSLIFIAGFFMMWSIFCRPFLLPLLAFSSLYIFIYAAKPLKQKLLLSFIYVSSFLIADSLWIIRNYRFEQKIIPLQSSIYKGANPLNHGLLNYKFIKSFGGEVTWWHPGSAGMWFRTDDYLKKYSFQRPPDNIFPKEIFTKILTIDTLKYARECFNMADDSLLNLAERKYYSEESVRVLSMFLDSFKNKYPFYYHVKAPLIVMCNFILQPYTYYFPYSFDSANLLMKLFKMISLFLNGIIILLGSISIFLIAIVKKFKLDKEDLLIMSVPVFIIILFSFIFRTGQYRYLVPAVPFLLLILFKFIHIIFIKLNNRGFSKISKIQ